MDVKINPFINPNLTAVFVIFSHGMDARVEDKLSFEDLYKAEELFEMEEGGGELLFGVGGHLDPWKDENVAPCDVNMTEA